MCFLGVGSFGFVYARCFGQVPWAEPVGDVATQSRDRFTTQLDSIRPHIGDQAGGFATNIDAFIQLLRDLHRAGGGKAQFA